MTVCIAALYNKGEGFVLVSDQMLTIHYPMAYQYENEEFEKISKLTSKADIYCLSAGNALFASEMIDIAKKRIENETITSVDDAAQTVRSAYMESRMSRLVRSQLETRGLDLDSYYRHHKSLLPDIVTLIDKSFATANIGVEFIVVGYDGSKCHIYTIIHPGDVYCNDSIGYAAIGIGAPHVIYHMIENNYRKSANRETITKLVENAKKRSQVAPGVGEKMTKVIIPKEI